MEKKKAENSKEKKAKLLALQRKYGTRITTAKRAREAFSQKDYVRAAKLYHDYLSVLQELKEVDDIYKISPTQFDHQTEITEMLLISHVYWDLARINEMTPKLQKAFQLSLDQFVKFTVNQPYQVLNAEMLRRYIKAQKGRSPQSENLNKAYNKIFVESSKCYIATMCFGENHPTTNTLRAFKGDLLKFSLGRVLVESYYRTSSILVEYLDDHPVQRKVTRITMYLPILLCAKLYRLLRERG